MEKDIYYFKMVLFYKGIISFLIYYRTFKDGKAHGYGILVLKG